MGKKPIVKLRVYRGKQMNYNKDGSVQNENQLISVEYNSMQWKLTMKTLSIMGYCEVVVDHILEDKNSEWVKNDKDIADYNKEVEDAYNPKSKIPKTADQLRIENLEAKIEELLAIKEPNEVVVEEDDSNLKELQLEYFELFEKKPHHMMKAERLIEEIDKFKNK
jgi:aspartate carbamoyltransferase regulatory subunit